MAKKFSFSDKNLKFGTVEEHHKILSNSLRNYYNRPTDSRFVGYTPDEVKSELNDRLSELDKASCLTILASIEARLRIDYIQRCTTRQKDNISRKMREVFRIKAHRAKLEDEILEI